MGRPHVWKSLAVPAADALDAAYQAAMVRLRDDAIDAGRRQEYVQLLEATRIGLSGNGVPAFKWRNIRECRTPFSLVQRKVPGTIPGVRP